MKDQPAPTPATPTPSPSATTRRRRWPWVFAAATLTLALLIVFLPAIAGALAPWAAKRFAPIAGRLDLSGTSFSWFSGQRIDRAALVDPDGQPVFDVGIAVDAGLWPLLRGRLDLGTVTLTGSATVVRRADGSTNLTRATAPKSQPATAQPAAENRVPDSLAVHLRGQNLSLTLRDEASGTTAVVDNITVDAVLAAGKPATLDLSGSARGVAGPAGAFSIKAEFKDWSDATGRVLIDPANPLGGTGPAFELAAELNALPNALIKALAGEQPARALGGDLTARASAKGNPQNATLELHARSTNLTAEVAAEIAGETARITRPLLLDAAGPAAEALAPAIANLTSPPDDASARLDAAPSLRVVVTEFAARIPRTGSPDLRGARLDAALDVAAMKGSAHTDAGPWKPFEIAPITARITSDDLAGQASLTASTRATFAGDDAGVIDINLTAQGLLDANGKPASGLPRSIAGKAEIRGIATVIAQPFLASSPIDLPNDVGPTLNLALHASASADRPGTSIQASIASEKVNAQGRFLLTADSFTAADDQASLTITSASAAVARLLAGAGPLSVTPGGSLHARLTELAVPIDPASGSPRFDQANITAKVDLPGWTITSRDNPAERVDFTEFKATVSAAPGQPAALSALARMTHRGEPFTAEAELRAPGLSPAAMGPFTIESIKPMGSLILTDAPTSLVRLLPPSAPDPSAAPNSTPDPESLADALRSTIGRAVGLRLTATTFDERRLRVDASLGSAGMTAQLLAELDDHAIDLKRAAAVIAQTPEGVASAARALKLDTVPRLTSPLSLNLTIDPVSIPLVPSGGLAPNAAESVLSASIISAGPITLEGLKAANVTPGPVGLDGLTARARAPLGALLRLSPAAPTTTPDASAEILAVLLDAQGQRAGSFKAIARASVDHQGNLTKASLEALATDLVTAAIDHLVTLPVPLADAAGDRLTVIAKASLTPPQGGGPITSGSGQAELSIDAPRLSTAEGAPIRIDLAPDRLTLTQPASLRLTPDPAFLSTVLKGQGDTPATRVTEIAPMTVSLNRLTLARGDASGPMKPGVFALDARAAAPTLTVQPTDGPRTSMRGFSIAASTPADGAHAIDLALAIASLSAGDAPPANDLGLKARLESFADDAGRFNADQARVTADGELRALPTALIDALAAQDGLLTEALGPSADLRLKADRFGKAGGTLTVSARSPRAQADLAGLVQGGAFLGSGQLPVRATVTEITPALSARFVKIAPLLGVVEKGPKDAPARVEVSSLRVPLNDDPATPADERKMIDADILIHPGEVSFAVSSDFAPLLAIIDSRAAGVAGQRLEPMRATARAGLLTVERWTVPLGEFRVPMEGRMNLVTGEVDFITWVPVGALSAEAGARVRGAAGAVVGDALAKAIVPIRTRGNAERRKTEMDLELFAKEFIKSIKPEDVLQRGLDQLLRPRK
ncbi:MAG: hypothetical protein HRU70_06795 [Phycisphaeraceae bacterium]|nr:MAG: hypothetical protein HRU70_06795 [Phycisphaeraceae bacterium]